MSFDNLQAGILSLSNGSDWAEAVAEWEFIGIHFNDNLQTCLCGHYPIREVCRLANRETENEVEVGNCCVNRFTGLKSNKLFDALKRVSADIHASFNIDSIRLAKRAGFIFKWERNFYSDIWRKRKLSPKQLAIKERINRKMLAQFQLCQPP